MWSSGQEVTNGLRRDRFSKRRIGAMVDAELFQQRGGFFQVAGVESFGEPTIDLRQHLAGFGLPAFLLKESAQGDYCPQLKRFRLLLAGNPDGLMEADCRFSGLALQFAFEPIQLRLCKPLMRLRRDGQRLVEG